MPSLTYNRNVKRKDPDDDLLKLPCACATLRRATRAVTQVYEQAFREVGLTAPQFTVLAVLHAFGELNQGKLSEVLAVDATTLTRILKIMLHRGWIHSKPGTDRREKYLRLTPAGTALFEEAKPLWQGVQNKVRDAFGAAEWSRMLTLVDRVTLGAQHINTGVVLDSTVASA
jgi:DNA-binding MarR family transcriptional regulator